MASWANGDKQTCGQAGQMHSSPNHCSLPPSVGRDCRELFRNQTPCFPPLPESPQLLLGVHLAAGDKLEIRHPHARDLHLYLLVVHRNTRSDNETPGSSDQTEIPILGAMPRPRSTTRKHIKLAGLVVCTRQTNPYDGAFPTFLTTCGPSRKEGPRYAAVPP